MRVIRGRNINEVYHKAMDHFRHGEEGFSFSQRPSRNGPMIEFDEPVSSVYKDARERVLFCPARDANPFLHFFESLWMIGGRNDLSFLTQFTKNMSNFSDDGETLNGAYGYRWRQHFARDQISDLVQHLKVDPMSRRAVTQMWDPNSDFPCWSLDHPCNISMVWKLRDGFLHLTVYNRSNDAIWGAYGANVVHFSMLQEYVACRLEAQVGSYTQVSNSLHVYPELPVTKRVLSQPPDRRDPYSRGDLLGPLMLCDRQEDFFFDIDLERFLQQPDGDYDLNTPFFRQVVRPMWKSHKLYKSGEDLGDCTGVLSNCAAPDWRLAGTEWLKRRKAA